MTWTRLGLAGETLHISRASGPINWQSVMFVGYGDDRELTDLRRLAPLDHQFFVKVSYAFQR